MRTLAPERADEVVTGSPAERTQVDIEFDLTVGELEADIPGHQAARSTAFTCYHPISCSPSLYCC